MASLRLQPPSAFNFRTPDEWPRWKKRFEQFRLASGLSVEAEEKQVSTLLYCMGEDADDTLTSTHITADERKQYQAVIAKLDGFFQVRRNVIFERARFNRRVQKEGESVEQFITSLYNLVETCDFGDLKNEMIRDRIVVGIRDQALSERLQTVADLTLEKAKTLVRQREAAHEHQLALNGSSKMDKSLDSVQKQAFNSRGRSHFPKKSQSASKGPTTKCTRCGRGPHPRHLCPAKDSECHKCHKRGHYSAQCLSKSVGEICDPPESLDDFAFLNTIGSDRDTSWTCTISVCGQDIPFKVDTGAEVTVVSEKYAEMLSPDMKPPSKQLHGPDRQPRVSWVKSKPHSHTKGSKPCRQYLWYATSSRIW